VMVGTEFCPMRLGAKPVPPPGTCLTDPFPGVGGKELPLVTCFTAFDKAEEAVRPIRQSFRAYPDWMGYMPFPASRVVRPLSLRDCSGTGRATLSKNFPIAIDAHLEYAAKGLSDSRSCTCTDRRRGPRR
jgi:hypothetical protein